MLKVLVWIILTFTWVIHRARKQPFLQVLGQWAQSNEVDETRQPFTFLLSLHIYQLFLSTLFLSPRLFLQFWYSMCYPRFPPFCLDNHIYSQGFKYHLCGTLNLQYLIPASFPLVAISSESPTSSNPTVHLSTLALNELQFQRFDAKWERKVSRFPISNRIKSHILSIPYTWLPFLNLSKCCFLVSFCLCTKFSGPRTLLLSLST